MKTISELYKCILSMLSSAFHTTNKINISNAVNKGGIAAAYYRVPSRILKEGRCRLTKEMLEAVDKFDELSNSKKLMMDENLYEHLKKVL